MSDSEDAHRQFTALAAAGDAEGVQALARRLSAGAPPPPRLIVAAAEAFKTLGDTAAALEWFARTPPGSQPYPYARAQMARIKMAAGDYEAVLALTGETPLDKLPEPLSIARVRAHVALGLHEEALRLVGQLQTVRPPTAALLEAAADAALAVDGWSAAYAFLDRAASFAPAPRSQFRRAVALFHLDRLLEAEVDFDALADNPEFSVRCGLYRARILQKRGQLEESITALDGVLEQDPDNELALDLLIRLHFEVRDFDSARKVFDRCAALFPQHFPPVMFDFLVNERRGRLRQALKPFRNGAIDDELSDAVREKIATAFYFCGQTEPARRLARTLDRDKNHLLQAKVGIAAGRRVDLQKLPTNREGTIVRAVGYYLDGRFSKCVEALDTLEPTSNEALAVNNLRNLARSGRVLSAKYFDRAKGVPIDQDGPLPVIQQLWVGSNLSYIEKLSIRSFVATGHEVHLYTYDPRIDAPPGCIIKDAGEILPESSIFAHSQVTGRSKGSLAGFADLFRWKLIHEKGGAWADADVVCLAPIRSRTIISTELARLGQLVLPGVTNCFFAAEKGQAAFLAAYRQAASLDRDALLWGEIGIHKMAELVGDHGWGLRLTAPTDLCPIPPFRMIDAIMGAMDSEAIIEETGCRAVHLYNEVMRMVGLDKNGAFPPQGLIGVLERRVRALETQMGIA